MKRIANLSFFFSFANFKRRWLIEVIMVKGLVLDKFPEKIMEATYSNFFLKIIAFASFRSLLAIYILNVADSPQSNFLSTSIRKSLLINKRFLTNKHVGATIVF